MLLDFSFKEQPIVLTYVNEKYLGFVQIGQKARYVFIITPIYGNNLVY